MKLIHLSDLHIGKRVNEYSMLEDQAYILLKIRNMGIKTIAEVETKLKDKGLSLRSDYE